MFGFGKKNQPQSAPAQPQQLSPEAQAILQRLQTQTQQMPAQQMPGQQPQAPQATGQPQDAQQLLMSALQAAPGQALQPQAAAPLQQQQSQNQMMPDAQNFAPQAPQPPAVQQIQIPNGGGFDLSGMNTPAVKTKRELKKEAAAAKRDEKEKKAKQAVEEKTRKKRRKQLSKMRFSRARYLREANANLISSIVLWLFMLLILIGGTVSLVNLYLAPITRDNQQTIQEIEQLQNTIINSQPQIQQALTARNERESEVQLLASTLPNAEQVRSQLEQFIARMKEAGITVADEDIQTVDLGSPAITGIQFSANLTTGYLRWLQERNRFMRRQAFARIPVERIIASDTSSEISVEVSIILPAAN